MREKLENIALKWTQSIGSVESLLIHTVLFVIAFILYFFGIKFNTILLVVTTIVSLEAIYLAIFIQMTVNNQGQKLHSVAKDVDEMQEDIEEMQEDIEEINEDINEDDEEEDDDSYLIEIKETVNKLMSEFGSIKKQMKQIQEGVEEINEEDDNEEDSELLEIKETMNKLIGEVKSLKTQLKKK